MASNKSEEVDETGSEIESINGEETDNDGKTKCKLNNYAKHRILAYLQNPNEHEKSPQYFDRLMKNSRCSRTDVADFINQRAKLSQANVHLECDSPSFQSINNWLEMLKEKGFNTITGNEISLLMKTIAILEDHPDPSQCDGINFQQLYQFLGNVMSGEPANELNQPTRTFLCDVFGEMINSVNSEKGDEELVKLQQTLLDNSKNNKKESEKSGTYKEDTFNLGLDPLNISNISDKDYL